VDKGELGFVAILYNLAIGDLLYREYRSVLDFVSGRLPFQGPRLLHVFERLDHFVDRYFESDEAKKIVQYSIGFLGRAPSNTPALYHIMSHIDLTMGVFYPEGGIRAVVEGVRSLAAGYGAEFRFNEPATRIRVEDGSAVAVETTLGVYPADTVLINADYRTPSSPSWRTPTGRTTRTTGRSEYSPRQRWSSTSG